MSKKVPSSQKDSHRLQESLIDLYLSVKIRSNEEVFPIPTTPLSIDRQLHGGHARQRAAETPRRGRLHCAGLHQDLH